MLCLTQLHKELEALLENPQSNTALRSDARRSSHCFDSWTAEPSSLISRYKKSMTVFATHVISFSFGRNLAVDYDILSRSGASNGLVCTEYLNLDIIRQPRSHQIRCCHIQGLEAHSNQFKPANCCARTQNQDSKPWKLRSPWNNTARHKRKFKTSLCGTGCQTRSQDKR